MGKKVILMILDGWGIAVKKEASAIDAAHTPFVDSLYTKYAHSQLNASGTFVGLPEGQMGNSEVGHMNIGAGRIVYQDLARLNKAVEDHEMAGNQTLLDALRYARENDKSVHLMGLVSDGGIHAHISHLKELIRIARENKTPRLFVHAFTDGRDTDPKSGKGFVQDIVSFMKGNERLASIIGRYYAMDRDKRWERVKLAYDLLVHGKGEKATDAATAIQKSYDADVTDEFIRPIVMTDTAGKPVATVQEGDVVICFNFRTDRGRQITDVLTQHDHPEQQMKTLPLYYVTMTVYDDSFKDVKSIFKKDNVANSLGEVLAKNGKKQIRIAETEKYPHVTFFFSGGREEPFDGEKRIMCPSPKVATYDLKPEMSASDIRDKIVPELKKEEVDFVCLNFANPDMVGHTGVFEAAVKACETVDACAKAVIETALAHGYDTIVIADHGNADCMINDDGTPNTAHTTNPVPCILVDPAYKGKLKNGKLGDIAPTILTLMGLPIPKEMTGNVLI